MKKTLILLLATMLSGLLFGCPPQLDPQNCGNCNEIRLFYCQGDAAPESLSSMVEENSAFVVGNTLLWFEDNSGSLGGLYNGTGEEPTVSTASTGKTFYWVAQNDGVCTGGERRVRQRVLKTPNVSIAAPPTPFCFGGQINLASLVSNPNKKADIYSFYDGDPNGGGSLLGVLQNNNGVPAGNLIVSPQVGVNEYWVIATNEGKTDCSAMDSTSLYLSMLATLDPVSDITVGNGDNVNLTFTSPNASFILWVDHVSFGNPDIGIGSNVGVGNLSFVASNPGQSVLTSKIRVIPYSGNCAGTLQDFFITVNPDPLRIAGLDHSNKIFPNPFNDAITINSDFDFHSVRIFTIHGVLVKTIKLEEARSRKLDLPSIPSGVYFIRIYGEAKSEGFKVLKL